MYQFEQFSLIFERFHLLITVFDHNFKKYIRDHNATQEASTIFPKFRTRKQVKALKISWEQINSDVCTDVICTDKEQVLRHRSIAGHPIK